MPFEFTTLPLPGLVLVKPVAFNDDRGFFLETYKASDFRSHGISEPFVQDNHSFSTQGVLRGLHFQRSPHSQSKLVRVVAGKIWDVAVDLRRGSVTFGKWYGVELSEENRLLFFIPAGFAHGFVTLSRETHVTYKCTAEYNRESDAGVRWDDPDLAIDWPVKNPRVSKKDASLPLLKALS